MPKVIHYFLMTAMLSLPMLKADAQTVHDVPYATSFDTKEEFDEFKVIDNNHDGSTWAYSESDQYAKYTYNKNNPGDDWLISPVIHFEQGKTYIFSFKYRNGYGTDRMAIAYGQGENPAENYTVLDAGFDISNHDLLDKSYEITPTKTGDYRMAFHAISDANKFYIVVDDIEIKAGVGGNLPDKVSDFSLVAGEQGKLSATVNFTTPTKDKDGNPLSSLTSVKIMRNGEVIHTIDAPATGLKFSQTFEGGNQGMNVFKVIASNSTGDGAEAEDSLWLGVDIPQEPKNVKVIDNGTTLSVSWEAPVGEGVHGGYVDPQAIKYNVYDYTESLKSNDITRNYFLDDDIDVTSFNNPIQYYVTATNSAGESTKGMTNKIYIGKVVNLPLYDSFPKGFSNQEISWWTDTKSWLGSSDKSVDNDGGCFRLDKEGTFVVNTNKISLKNEASPYIRFAYYVQPNTKNHLKVIGSKMQKEEMELLDINDATVGKEGWQTFYASLLPLKDKNGYVVIRLQGTCESEANPLYIDKVEITNLSKKDLSIDLNGSQYAKVGKVQDITATISNVGIEKTGKYNVKLFINDDEVSTKEGMELNPNENQKITFSYEATPAWNDTVNIHAELVYAEDNNEANNKSGMVQNIVVKNSIYARPTNLSGTISNGTAKLNWTAPKQKETVTETFDTYNAWSINYVGDWTLIDNDKQETYGISGLEFPNHGDPMAYIVFNPQKAGLNFDEDPEIAPKSGSQFMASFAVLQLMERINPNDDYIISPKLNGNEQTISFWAKSLFEKNDTASLLESFEVLASTTEPTIAALKAAGLSDNAVPADQWKNYNVTLPAGTKYFAIHCNSKNKFMFMLDDVTYSPAPLVLKGYRIYRDGKLVKTLDGAENTNYTDNEAGEGGVYTVTALYEEGESNFSDPKTITTGIENINSDIRSNEGNYRYNISGQRVSDDYKGIVIQDGKKFVVK